MYNNKIFIKNILSLKKVYPIEKIQKINNEFIIVVKPEYLLDLLTFLKNHVLYQYKILSSVSGVDYPLKKKRFEVCYDLLSVIYNSRVRVKVCLNELTPVESCMDIYSAANWYEREIWDLYGVFFKNHKDLRRILTDYGFEGHPLRKDFPLSGYVEVKYSENSKRVISETLEFSQEYRVFDFVSPWSITKDISDQSSNVLVK